MAKLLLILAALLPLSAAATPLVDPGDTRLRHDLELLNDNGVINVPLTAWPLSAADLRASLEQAGDRAVSPGDIAAFRRARQFVGLDSELETRVATFALAGSQNSRFVRTFENTPRDEGELRASVFLSNDRFSLRLSAAAVANPFDEDEIRPDGTFVGVTLGNWIVSAGWQERWWGPSREGSLILSTNARPSPGIAVQRRLSRPFETKWLRWMGPWTLTSFITELDDERSVSNARLFGVRGTFRPPKTGLEIGISRTAQWCGDGRPCGLSTFSDLLLGNDNQGVNVDPQDEPGNQLGGFDIRWRLPKQLPVALYMQWIGEDGRDGGGAIGSWMRQLGIEHWGRIGGVDHRTTFEIADSMCREGGFGFSDEKPNCAYEHAIYTTGYRYRGKVVGYPVDGDGLSYSLGSTLVQSGGESWNFSLRYMKINRLGSPNPRHTLSSIPQKVIDMQITHKRPTEIGQFYVGLGFSDADNQAESLIESDMSVFVQWSSK